MKITVVAVSAPALCQLTQFQKEFSETYGEKSLEFRMFYVASAGAKLLALEDTIVREIASADIAVVDIMGASESMQDLVRRGLEKCKGQRVVIGNACRDLNRLGAFSMDMMQKMKKETGKDSSGRAEQETTKQNATRQAKAGQCTARQAKAELAQPTRNTAKQIRAAQAQVGQKEAKQKPKKNAAKMMHMMRRMALMMGSIAPFGMMKDMKNLFLLIDYWQQAEREDIFSFMHLLLRNYAGMKQLPKEKPCSMKYGIYLKNPVTKECTEKLQTYWKKEKFEKGKPLIALLFYGHSYPNDFRPVVCAVYEKLKDFANVLPIAFSQNEDKDLPKLEKYLSENEVPVDAIINFMPFRLGAGPMGGDADGAVEILKKIKAPYLKPFCLTKVEREEWERESGVNPGEFLISIMLPELDGGILTYPVGIMTGTDSMESQDLNVTRMEPMEERIESLCARVRKYIELRGKVNEAKKVAIICYNYPPGEDNLFGGAFLDTFSSVAVLLKTLKENGYCTEEMDAEQLKAYFCDGVCNEPRWSDGKKAELTCYFDGKTYPVKGIRLGNVFIGLQPCRVEGMSEETSYHDKNLEPPKAYQAFYHWLGSEFRADAVIHMGTHGTLEFLPGKDSGMMGSCWPDRLIGDMPHFYYYYMGNPSEAMTAKRRSHAVLVSYQPPRFVPGGLYGDYQKLKMTIAEYRESLQLAPERSGDILETIQKLAGALGLIPEKNSGTENKDNTDNADDMGINAAVLDELDELLYEYETSLVPDGLHILEKDELSGMITALNGEYLPAAPAGDVLKNPDILPAGRNLVQFDPRLVPTKTAFERGEEIARRTLERYEKENGHVPESAAVILWGLETSKTQGETIGQILYYLGVRMRQFEGSFDTRFEVIPTEELQRPRVDVTIHICGFFRDMYPNLVDNLNEIFKKLDALEESDTQSAFAKDTRRIYRELLQQGYPEREAKELARSRIFGPKAGEYGTSLTEQVRKGCWTEEAELALGFTDSLSHIYSERHRGVQVKGLLELNYQQVELMSQVRNNMEYELIDLDHYYEFYGGLAKAVENVRGEKEAMYVADTTGADVRMQDVKASLEKGIRTRLLNPKWIEGMMRHDYHGVQQISRRFENVMGMTATTNQIDSRLFSELEKCYVEDEELKKRMQKSNRWAYLNMLNRLAEAGNRGYWQPTQEEMERLQRAYLETEGEMEQ